MSQKTTSISPNSLNSSRYFVVQSARQSRSARGRSSYRKESTYSHMQVNLRVYSELFSALLNIFASTPSRNRTYNCPLGELRCEFSVVLAGGVKVLGMPVASQVDTILSFFKYFSFLCDLGCFGMVVLAGY